MMDSRRKALFGACAEVNKADLNSQPATFNQGLGLRV